jgi:hypothetical protein
VTGKRERGKEGKRERGTGERGKGGKRRESAERIDNSRCEGLRLKFRIELMIKCKCQKIISCEIMNKYS